MTRLPRLPYAHLNLRANPFRELAPEERGALAVVDVEAWVAHIRKRRAAGAGPTVTGRDAQAGGAARPDVGMSPPEGGTVLVLQLLGPSGVGKTTHLDALHRHFPDAPRVAWSAPSERERRARRVPDGWPPVPPGDLLFVDDAHAFPRRRWAGVLAGRRTLVVATQRDLTPMLQKALAGRPGRGPTSLDVRTSDLTARVTPDVLRRIVARRLESARRGDGSLPKIEAADVVSLLRRHGPDLRAVLDDLYRRIQAHPPVTP